MNVSPTYWFIKNRNAHCTKDTTHWFHGGTKPTHIGWYDRLFTDGIHRHWWDGYFWLTDSKNKNHHWRQVGAYPLWRGSRTRAHEYTL